jgi:hypothetical protein
MVAQVSETGVEPAHSALKERPPNQLVYSDLISFILTNLMTRTTNNFASLNFSKYYIKAFAHL